MKSEAAKFKTRKINAAIEPDVKRFSHQIKRTRFSAHITVIDGGAAWRRGNGVAVRRTG